jgi:transposase
MEMISEIVWNEIKMLIPEKSCKVGRPMISAKLAMSGIVYIMKTGCQWRFLPRIYGSKSSVHRSLKRWTNQGVFKAIHQYYVQKYLAGKNEETIWMAIDASNSKAPYAVWGGANSTDRGKQGIKKSIIVDWNGAPLAIVAGPANTHDSQFFHETFEQINLIPCSKTRIIAADAAYDVAELKQAAARHNFVLFARTNPRRNKNQITIHKPGHRWVIERTFSWLHQFRGIKTCWTKSKAYFESFLQLAATLQITRRIVL